MHSLDTEESEILRTAQSRLYLGRRGVSMSHSSDNIDHGCVASSSSEAEVHGCTPRHGQHTLGLRTTHNRQTSEHTSRYYNNGSRYCVNRARVVQLQMINMISKLLVYFKYIY